MSLYINYLSQINAHVQSIFLMIVMIVFVAALGFLMWGIVGLVFLLISFLIISLIKPDIPPSLIMHVLGAEKLDLNDIPQLNAVFLQLVHRSQLKSISHIYYLPNNMVNSFATGTPYNSAIAITDGLLKVLSFREITGVLAHEISHIQSNDISIMWLGDAFSRMTSLLSLIGQLLLLLNFPLIILGQVRISWLLIFILVLAPLVSTLAQLGLSRAREYEADYNAAILTGDPEGLASAIIKINNIQYGWFKRILMPGRGIPEPSLFRTHPSTDERVRRLLSFNK